MSLDREAKQFHEIIVEAEDQGSPSKTSRVPIKIYVLDINDNPPVIVDPQTNIVNVHEDQVIGTEVTKIKAIDNDFGNNASIVYSIVKGIINLTYLVELKKTNYF